jgi:hypothetical protein
MDHCGEYHDEFRPLRVSPVGFQDNATVNFWKHIRAPGVHPLS